MKHATIKKILIWSGGTFAFLVLVLAIHIYVVTRPKLVKPISPNSRTMARIDLHQAITQDDANKITAWLFQQKGVEHVYVSTKSDKALFLFFTTQTTGNKVVQDFKDQMHYENAVRYLPTTDDYAKGCPVVAVAYTEKIAHFFRHIF